MDFKEVHKGIDSLYMSFWGQIKDGILEELETKKRLAQSEDMNDISTAVKVIGNHRFEVRDKGQGNYSFIIVDGWFFIKISASQKKLIPTVYVQISSELLNCSGLDYSVNELRNVINDLLIVIEKEKVSRVDIFVDFKTDSDFEMISKQAWITRADQVHKYWTGSFFTGWTVGRGGDISARLYEKTIEIEVSGKKFFTEIWSKADWQNGQPIWRLEFQLKRLFLSQLKMNSISDVVTGTNDIWKICTQDWLRLAIENSDDNRTRWKTSPVWLALQAVKFGDGNYAGFMREVSKQRIPSEERLLINCLGYIISYAVIHGYDNVAESALSLLRAAGSYLDICALESTKFTDSLDYVNKKMKLKKRLFNIDGGDVPF